MKRLKNSDKVIGYKLKKLRVAKGFSRQQIAKLIHITHQQIAKYELGTNRISATRLLEIAKVLGVTTDYFLKDLEDFIPSPSTHDRLLIELARLFVDIPSTQQQVALVALARTMSRKE